MNTTDGFRLLDTKMQRESAHAQNCQFKIPAKSVRKRSKLSLHFCVNARKNIKFGHLLILLVDIGHPVLRLIYQWVVEFHSLPFQLQRSIGEEREQYSQWCCGRGGRRESSQVIRPVSLATRRHGSDLEGVLCVRLQPRDAVTHGSARKHFMEAVKIQSA